MDILTHSLSALWQVVAVGLLIGAGLPALFALGIRTLNPAPAGARAAGGPNGPDGPKVPSRPSLPGAARSGLAAACFGVCVLAVLFGIVVIVFGKQLFGG